MKPRNVLILTCILFVLGGLALLLEQNRQKSFSPRGNPIFRDYAETKADGIEIVGGGRTVTLARRGETWMVANEGMKPADPKLPKQILEAMEEFSTTTLISNSRERHAGFEVDTTGFSVRISQHVASGRTRSGLSSFVDRLLGRARPDPQGSTTLASFVVGKPGPDFMSTYVRPEGKDAVYLIPVYLRTFVDRGEQSWRNLTILEVEPDAITGWTTRRADGSITVEKGADGSWMIKDPVEAPTRPEVASIVLRTLTTIRATGFADTTLGAVELGLEPDTTSIVIRTADGSSHTIVVGAANERNQSYTQKLGDPTVYLVPRGRWNTVLRPLDTLQAPEGEADVPPGAGATP